MDYEVVRRLAERISDHAIVDTAQLWKCSFCGKWGHGMRDYSYHLAEELACDLGVEQQNQWIPRLESGKECKAIPSYQDAELIMLVSPDIVRVDREYRMVSRWFRPSRDG